MRIARFTARERLAPGHDLGRAGVWLAHGRRGGRRGKASGGRRVFSRSGRVLRDPGAAGPRRVVRPLSRREEAVVGAAARLAQGGARRRGQRTGPGSRQSRREPADPGHPPDARRDQDAAEGEAPRRGARCPVELGEDGRAVVGGDDPDGRDPRPGEPVALGVPAGPRARPAGGQGRGLGRHAGRCLHPRAAREGRAPPLAPRRQADADPPRDVRPDRPAADAGGGRGVRGRPVARRPSPRSSIACSPRPGTASAGAATGSTSPAMPTPRATSFKEERRYPYSYTYRDYVIRSFNEDKPYDRFLVEQIAADQLDLRRRPPAPGGARVPDRRPPLPERRQRDHRRPDRRRGPRPAGPDRRLCPLPRPQVRPDPDRGLLLALRRLRQLGRAQGAARHRRGRDRAQRRATSSASFTSANRNATSMVAKLKDEFKADVRSRIAVYLKAAFDLDFSSSGRRRQARRAGAGRQAPPGPAPRPDDPLAGMPGGRQADARPDLRPLAHLGRAAGR